MKIKTFATKNVRPDGTVVGGGAVEVNGSIRMSMGEGCGESTCHCSDGHWVSIIQPRSKRGVVRGVQVFFDNMEEMLEFMSEHQVDGKSGGSKHGLA